MSDRPFETVRIRVRVQVQGLGFRPFVWKLATAMGLRGEVMNDPEGVLIFVCGTHLTRFAEALRREAPPLARVDAVEVAAWVFASPPVGFSITASRGNGAQTGVMPDMATCPDCLAEIRGDGRRAGYGFANCTHCGPRFSILRGLPYDRAQTSMAAFQMCPACRAEYQDPADRRFHAQPIACPDCGPRAWFATDGAVIEGDAIALAVEALRAGRIVAIKGIGGFHLACDAMNAGAVALLRVRKRRPAKPFALMGSEATIAQYCQLDAVALARLRHPSAPIVLLPCRTASLPDEVAPGMGNLGWMRPYTPLHHVLMDAFEGPLVMTSGNRSGEPQVTGNAEARSKLGRVADDFVMHDREIVRRLDDSVERADPPMVLRRARGQAPGTFALPPGFAGCGQIAAYGGQMKSAICLIKDGRALLSHHLGDLDDALSWEEFLRAEADYADLFDHHPTTVACDLHDGYRTTRHAQGLGLPLIRTQHHHAHLAACLGENLWPLQAGPVAGIILDGLGLGSDGTFWGGEVLLGDYRGFTRIAHLRPAALPGGDRASAEPWRNALARLDQAGLATGADQLFQTQPRALLRQAIHAGINAPLSSSAGRLFDAVAAILGLCPDRQTYEGEAAMRLEALASPDAVPFAFGASDAVLDPAPMLRDLIAGLASTPKAVLSSRFHVGLAQAFCAPARRLVESGQAKAVALSGGCFQNAVLLRACCDALQGLPVLIHCTIPANDGGLALGQALIAAAAGCPT